MTQHNETRQEHIAHDNENPPTERILNAFHWRPGDHWDGYYLSLYGCAATLIGDFEGESYAISAAHCEVELGSTIYYNNPTTYYAYGDSSTTANDLIDNDYYGNANLSLPSFAYDYQAFNTAEIIHSTLTNDNTTLPYQAISGYNNGDHVLADDFHVYSIPTATPAIHMILYSNNSDQFDYTKLGHTGFVSGFGSHDFTDAVNDPLEELSTHLSITPTPYITYGGTGGYTFLSPYDESLSTINYSQVSNSQNMYGAYDDEANEGIDSCQGDSGGPLVALLYQDRSHSLDLNEDGAINLIDIAQYINEVIFEQTLSCADQYDLNSDLLCNIYDVIEFVQVITSENPNGATRQENQLMLYKSEWDSTIGALQSHNAMNALNNSLITGSGIPLQVGIVSWGSGCGDYLSPGVYTDPASQFAQTCDFLIGQASAETWIEYFNITGNNGIVRMGELKHQIDTAQINPHAYTAISCTVEEILELESYNEGHSTLYTTEYMFDNTFSNQQQALEVFQTYMDDFEEELIIFESIIIEYWLNPDAAFNGVCDSHLENNSTTTCTLDCANVPNGVLNNYPCTTLSSFVCTEEQALTQCSADYYIRLPAESCDDSSHIQDCSSEFLCVSTSFFDDTICSINSNGLDLSCYETEALGDCSCDSDEVVDCDGSLACWPESWIGDGYGDCEDQEYEADLTCYENDGGDCPTTCITDSGAEIAGACDTLGDNYLCHLEDQICAFACLVVGCKELHTCITDTGECINPDIECQSDYVFDCDDSGECWPESWIGDGNPDCEDQTWNADLTCYENDGGDCDEDITI